MQCVPHPVVTESFGKQYLYKYACVYIHIYIYIYMCENIFSQECYETQQYKSYEMINAKHAEGGYDKSIIQFISRTSIGKKVSPVPNKVGKARTLPFSRWARGHTQRFCQIKFAMEILC